MSLRGRRNPDANQAALALSPSEVQSKGDREDRDEERRAGRAAEEQGGKARGS